MDVFVLFVILAEASPWKTPPRLPLEKGRKLYSSSLSREELEEGRKKEMGGLCFHRVRPWVKDLRPEVTAPPVDAIKEHGLSPINAEERDGFRP